MGQSTFFSQIRCKFTFSPNVFIASVNSIIYWTTGGSLNRSLTLPRALGGLPTTAFIRRSLPPPMFFLPPLPHSHNFISAPNMKNEIHLLALSCSRVKTRSFVSVV